MKDVALYQQLLGLPSPWHVQGVTLKLADKQIEVHLECEPTVWACPDCHHRMHVHAYETRTWRHLDSCQCQTWVVASVPRVRCATHGSQVVRVPWAEPYSRFTTWFERFAIDLLQECSARGAGDLLGISWDEADGIKQRAVKRGLARKETTPARQVCVDEKGLGRGQDYVTIVAKVEPEQLTVDYVGEGKSQESLDPYWQSRTPAQRAAVETVSMDLGEAYRQSTLAHIPQAQEKIVFDPFHVIQHLNKAVNQVRRAEQRRLEAQGDQILKGTRYLWLYGRENLPEKYHQRRATLLELNLQTTRAYMIKEELRNFWHCETVPQAEQAFQTWYSWAIRSRLVPIKKVARMCKEHLGNLLTFFQHRLTNGPMEGLNNKVQGLIHKAFGYRNKQRFMRDIYFHLGGLNLYPA